MAPPGQTTPHPRPVSWPTGPGCRPGGRFTGKFSRPHRRPGAGCCLAWPRPPLGFAPDTVTLCTDLGFMLLQAVVETVSGLNLDRFCEERIFGPLGLEVLGFNPLSIRAQAVPPLPETENRKPKTAFTPPPSPASFRAHDLRRSP